MRRFVLCLVMGLVVLGESTFANEAWARTRSKTATVSRHTPSKRAAGRSSKRNKKKRNRWPTPEIPRGLELVRYDLVTGQGQVVVWGTKREPQIRLLVLSDDRGRRFLPELTDCELPKNHAVEETATQPENSRWRCTFLVPETYRQSALAAVSMEWGERFVDAPQKNVAAVYAAAAAKQVPDAPLPKKDVELQKPKLASPEPLPEGGESGENGDSSQSDVVDEEAADRAAP